MGYLKRLPLAALKIDRSFVRDLYTDQEDEAIVAAIIALARSLKLKVVAERVETQAQLALLQAMRCDEYQDFLNSRALEPTEFAELVRQSETQVARRWCSQAFTSTACLPYIATPTVYCPGD